MKEIFALLNERLVMFGFCLVACFFVFLSDQDGNKVADSHMSNEFF